MDEMKGSRLISWKVVGWTVQGVGGRYLKDS